MVCDGLRIERGLPALAERGVGQIRVTTNRDGVKALADAADSGL